MIYNIVILFSKKMVKKCRVVVQHIWLGILDSDRCFVVKYESLLWGFDDDDGNYDDDDEEKYNVDDDEKYYYDSDSDDYVNLVIMVCA